MTLIERLRQAQGERSQGEFARDLGVSQSALSMLYTGKRPLGPKMARRLVDAHPELALVLAEALLAARADGERAA